MRIMLITDATTGLFIDKSVRNIKILLVYNFDFHFISDLRNSFFNNLIIYI